ncbi:MAG: hypothetical protein D6730_22575 [Bacteroidetes bacterium]|nr:MAG: hypothetical protein D6730_22575 [Bacteroidota bacterium]
MVRIFVEGKQDKAFIEAYIQFLQSETHPFTHIEVIAVGGWTNLAMVDNLFKENSDMHGKNLVIFDADYPPKGGGVAKRKQEILRQGAELHIEFERNYSTPSG